MAELKPETDRPSISRRALFYIGACALLLIMTVETIAVIGRHIGWPLLGAIEIIQAAILIAACTATVIATIDQAHATVHLLTDRVRPSLQSLLHRFAAALSTLFFLGLAIAAIWLAIDYWHANEETELLHISFRPLRIAMSIAIATVACIFAYRVVRSPRRLL